MTRLYFSINILKNLNNLALRLLPIFLIIFTFTTICIATKAIANEASLSPLLMSNLRSSNGVFVGREEFLSEMHNFLFNEKKSHALIISGSPGAGKTEVITRYTELYKKSYEIIWWFDVNKNMDEQCREFARKWNKLVNKHYKDTSEQVFLQISLDTNNAYNIQEEVYDRLKNTKLNWLVILDNVKDNVTTLKNMPKHDNKGYGHIIISTQNSTYHPNVMHLEKLSRDESIELIIKITGKKDRKKAELLAETLKDYPLAISSVGTFIALYPAIDIEEYNQLFLTKREKLWEAERKYRAQWAEFDNYKNTIFTSLSLIINQIKKESKLAYELLSIASFLDNENIPETILLQYVKNKYSKESLDIEFNKALSILMKHSLLSPSYVFDKTITKGTENIEDAKNTVAETNDPNNSLLITHELIQIVMQDLLSLDEKEFYLNQAIIATNQLLPQNIYLLTDFLSQSSYFIPHINSLIKNGEDFQIYNNDIMLLSLRSLEYHLTIMRHDQEAEELINKLNIFAKKVSEIDGLIKMRIAIMKSAFLAWVKIDYQASLKEALLAYNLAQKLAQELNDPALVKNKLMIYTLLARMYNFIDDDASALKYIQLGQQIIEKTSKTTDLFGYKQDFLISVAKIAIDNGKYNQALNFYNLSKIDNNLNLQNKQNETLPSNLSVYLLSVDIFLSIGKLDQAKKKLKALKRITDKLSAGNFYKISVISYNNYIEALLGADLSRAIENALESQAMFKKLFGEKNYYRNRHVSMSYKFLGELYERQGNLTKAKQEYLSALKILTNVYSQSTCASTDKLSDIYYKLAIINIKLQDLEEAMEYCKLHSRVFGMDHPRSIRLFQYFVRKKVSLRF